MITISGTTFMSILGGKISYFKYGIATGKVRHFPTLCNRKSKVPVPQTASYHGNVSIQLTFLLPQLISTTMPIKSEHKIRQGKPVSGKNHLGSPYNAQTDKALIRSVTLIVLSSA